MPADATAQWVFAVAVVLIVGAAIACQCYRARQQRLMFEAALAAGSEGAARDLLSRTWFAATVKGLAMAGSGIGLSLAALWGPNLRMLVVPALILIFAGVPMAVYSARVQRREEQRQPRPQATRPACVTLLLAMGVALALAVLAPVVVYMLSKSPGPTPLQSAAFNAAVEKDIHAPIGTVDVTISGHKAHGILTGGGAWGKQACGSPYNPRLRFETAASGFLNVYYVPDTDQYWVFGRAKVLPSGKIVQDGPISTREALGEQ